MLIRDGVPITDPDSFTRLDFVDTQDIERVEVTALHETVEIDGFQGCCNPVRIAVMEDGSFVTSEKGVVRIKIYDQSGTLRSVVAAPDLFKEEGKAPDVCVDSAGVVYALDMDRNVIRIFEPLENG